MLINFKSITGRIVSVNPTRVSYLSEHKVTAAPDSIVRIRFATGNHVDVIGDFNTIVADINAALGATL